MHMTDIPVKDQIYRHFKGNLYRIVTVAIHSETGERMVVYQALYGDYTVYVRELSMFMGKVDRNRYPDADQEERFKLLTQIIGQESGASLQVRTSPDEPIRIQAGTDETVQTPETDGDGMPAQAADDNGVQKTGEDNREEVMGVGEEKPLPESKAQGQAPGAGEDRPLPESKAQGQATGADEDRPLPESKAQGQATGAGEDRPLPESKAGDQVTGADEQAPDWAAGDSVQTAAENVQAAKAASGDAAEHVEETKEPSDAVEGGEAEDEMAGLDPFLLEFLDADTYRERLNLLAALHVRLTDDMLNTMAVSVDVEIGDGDLETRYEALKNCLLTLEKYECNRVR
jgi:hypothetical protein